MTQGASPPLDDAPLASAGDASDAGVSAASGGGAPSEATTAHEGTGLKRRAYVGAFWTAFSHMGENLIGFASNILLTYLLVPEVMGIMALVNTVNTGLQMFSDVGIGPSLIQNKREDPAFYNTAWSMQVFRGFVLWLVACMIALPLSMVQDDWGPLLWLLPVAGFNSVLNGLRSTAWITASRHLKLRAIALVTMVTTVVRIATMIAVAYWVTRSAWALVAGLLVGNLFLCVGSHFIIPEIRNRFCLERKAFHELIHFGKWLFLSTIVTFFALQVDKFLLAGLLSTGALGLYWIGTKLAEVAPMLSDKIGHWVGYPALSEIYRRDPDRFGDRLLYMRKFLTLPTNALLILAIFIGPVFTAMVYSGPYGEAGWILQVLALNSLAAMVTGSYRHVYLATGNTIYNLLSVSAQLVAVLGASLIGYYGWGETGFILGLGITQWLKYLADAVLVDRCGFLQAKFDIWTLGISGFFAWLAILGSQWLAQVMVL